MKWGEKTHRSSNTRWKNAIIISTDNFYTSINFFVLFLNQSEKMQTKRLNGKMFFSRYILEIHIWVCAVDMCFHRQCSIGCWFCNVIRLTLQPIQPINLETVLSHSSFSPAIFLSFFSFQFFSVGLRSITNTRETLTSNYARIEIPWIEINWNEQMNKTLTRNQNRKKCHAKFTVALTRITHVCVAYVRAAILDCHAYMQFKVVRCFFHMFRFFSRCVNFIR